MGFWKRLLGREESTNPFGQPDETAVEVTPSTSPPPPSAGVSTPLVSIESGPMHQTWTSVTVNGKPVPPEQAEAFTAAFEQLGNLASAGSSQVVDLTGRPELRDKVLGAMREHSDDPMALQNAVFEALGAAGPKAEPPAEPAAPPGKPDPYEQLRKLDELRDQGVLTDAEFEAKKKQLLDRL
jgi:Short C-terminal domain